VGGRDGFGESDSSGKEEERGGLAPDDTVEASGSKAKALPDVVYHLRPLARVRPLANTSTYHSRDGEKRDELTQHSGRDVDACPDVSLSIEDLARQGRNGRASREP